MMERRAQVPPRYDLSSIKSAVEAPSFRIGESVRKECRRTLGEERTAAQLDALILGTITRITEADYACPFDLTLGSKRVRADVYGPRDDCGRLWYVKVAVVDGRTRLYSCHLADHDLEMFDGTIRRKVRS